jgi:hypothetical protein
MIIGSQENIGKMNKQKSKAFYQFVQLLHNINNGLDCAVATRYPDKYIEDFNYWIGEDLILSASDKNDIYIASLHKINEK